MMETLYQILSFNLSSIDFFLSYHLVDVAWLGEAKLPVRPTEVQLRQYDLIAIPTLAIFPTINQQINTRIFLTSSPAATKAWGPISLAHLSRFGNGAVIFRRG